MANPPDGPDRFQDNCNYWPKGSSLNRIVDYIRRTQPRPNAKHFNTKNLNDGIHFELLNPCELDDPEESIDIDVVTNLTTASGGSDCITLTQVKKTVTFTPRTIHCGGEEATLWDVSIGEEIETEVDSFAACGGGVAAMFGDELDGFV